MNDNELYRVYISPTDLYKLQGGGLITVFSDEGKEFKLQIDQLTNNTYIEKEKI